MSDYRQIYLAMLAALLAGIAFALIFVACAAMAQERHGAGRGGGFGHGRPDDRGGGYSRPAAPGGVTINKYYGSGGRQYYHDRRPGYSYAPGYGWFNPSAAIGGAVGGWLWRQWAQPAPEPEPVRGMEWCMNRYKSYDPYTKTYLGYDGLRHGCP